MLWDPLNNMTRGTRAFEHLFVDDVFSAGSRGTVAAVGFETVGEHASRAVAERGFQLDRHSRGG